MKKSIQKPHEENVPHSIVNASRDLFDWLMKQRVFPADSDARLMRTERNSLEAHQRINAFIRLFAEDVGNVLQRNKLAMPLFSALGQEVSVLSRLPDLPFREGAPAGVAIDNLIFQQNALGGFLAGLHMCFDDESRNLQEVCRIVQMGPSPDKWQGMALKLSELLDKVASETLTDRSMNEKNGRVSTLFDQIQSTEYDIQGLTPSSRWPFDRLSYETSTLRGHLARGVNSVPPRDLAQIWRDLVRGKFPIFDGLQPWVDGDPDYIPGKEALERSGYRIDYPKLTRLTKSGCSIRHMRRGQRLKVHWRDLKEYIDSLPPENDAQLQAKLTERRDRVRNQGTTSRKPRSG